MTLPQLTHLHAAILDILADQIKTGAEIRAALKKRHIQKSGPNFYQIMKRLEESSMIVGNYQERVDDGQRIRERCYRMSRRGQQEFTKLHRFYNSFENKDLAVPEAKNRIKS